MSFLKKIFGKKEEKIKSYSDFWKWFQQNEKDFFNIIKNHTDIEKGFFSKISPKLSELKEGYFYVTGMYNDETVELILTADGNTKNIVFVEELVAEAPLLDGWKFTALKPSLDIKDVNIQMSGYTFNEEKIYFYSTEYKDYPDEIDITIIHLELTEENRSQITMGVYIFLDNYLGELDLVNNIDNITILGSHDAKNEIIPIAKLKDFLTWRQKEFIEKYEGARYDTEKDEHSILEVELKNGNMLVAVVNSQLLKWDRKASHPWIAVLTIKYDGSNNNGMPKKSDIEILYRIEDELMKMLKDKDGYLNIGRQTANNERNIYFACRDFRKPSKVYFETQLKHLGGFEIDYSIYKDKYWQSFERFKTA